ncbi:UbiA family prenyltransferase [Jatrophihabitans sp. DSM 45814]
MAIERDPGAPARHSDGRVARAREVGLELALACHPAPTVAVTVLTTVLVAVAGNRWPTCVVATLALLSGQLSIGWSNDLIDADRDAAAGRSDKPAAAGTIARSTLMIATVMALVCTVPLSFGLGWRAGLAHLTGVGAGWLYNLGVKATVASPLPYAVAFGALPAIATLATPDRSWPPGWAILAGSLIGVAAHFGNVLPDITEDLAEGVRGLPQRIGRRASALTAALAVVAATIVILIGPSRTPSALDWACFCLVVLLAVSGVASNARNPRSEVAFYAVMAAAALDIVLIALSHGLTVS